MLRCISDFFYPLGFIRTWTSSCPFLTSLRGRRSFRRFENSGKLVIQVRCVVSLLHILINARYRSLSHSTTRRFPYGGLVIIMRGEEEEGNREEVDWSGENDVSLIDEFSCIWSLESEIWNLESFKTLCSKNVIVSATPARSALARDFSSISRSISEPKIANDLSG